jgi:hypothetical protein
LSNPHHSGLFTKAITTNPGWLIPRLKIGGISVSGSNTKMQHMASLQVRSESVITCWVPIVVASVKPTVVMLHPDILTVAAIVRLLLEVAGAEDIKFVVVGHHSARSSATACCAAGCSSAY